VIIITSGVINSDKNTNLVSQQTIYNDGDITAKNNISLRAVDVYNINNLNAMSRLTISANGQIVNTGDMNDISNPRM